MKFAVILAVAVACAMASPQSNTAGKFVSSNSDGVVKRSPASALENHLGQNPVVRKRRVNVVDENGKVVDFDDDDLQFVTTGLLSGRQVSFRPDQSPPRLSNFGSVASSGQANSDFVFINDDSREAEDHDEFDDDDLAIISPNRLSWSPFVNRLNAAFVPQSSIFNPSPSFVRAPFRQTRMNPRFVQSTSTCTCPPQTVTRFPQAISPSRVFQYVRFPRFPTLPSVQFSFDD